MNGIVYRELKPGEIDLIAGIDRGEEITAVYKFTNNTITLVPHQETVHRFDPAELHQIISTQYKIQQQGGVVIGAFDNQTLAGVASVENLRRGSTEVYYKMDILYVSKQYRGKKIGETLLLQCKEIAKRFGAEKLYISATPTKNTVDFYFRHGAVPAKETDMELFTLEPEDIHLELTI